MRKQNILRRLGVPQGPYPVLDTLGNEILTTRERNIGYFLGQNDRRCQVNIISIQFSQLLNEGIRSRIPLVNILRIFSALLE